MRVVIFDLDGTLVDTAPDIIDALNRSLVDSGLAEVDDAAGRSFIGGGARQLVKLGVVADRGEDAEDELIDSTFDRFLTYYGESSTDRSVIYPGVRDVLEQFASENLPMGVCTNKPHDISLVVLEALDLMRYFRTVIGGDALPVRKPQAGHILETAARTLPGYSQAIMIGDSATDVAAARNSKVPVVAVSYGYTNVPAVELGADAVIDHMRDLPAAIEPLWAGA
jgi:phosphoglycolate phosphatase